ncbi:MAG: NnrU family protein [Mariprofundales bacterium]
MNHWDSTFWIWLSGLVFALIHSLLASHRCKEWLYEYGLREPRYRLLYSVTAMVATGVWVFFVHQLPDMTLYQTDGLLWWLLVSMQLLGLLVVLAAFQPIDGLVFLGLRGAGQGGEPFIVRGVYRHIRHPMYAGAMLLLLAAPGQTWNGFHFTVVICLYFIIGSRFEEGRMAAIHPDYESYRRCTPAFVPLLKSKPTDEFC